MKKLFALMLALAMLLSLANAAAAESTVIDKLTVYFVPSASVAATNPSRSPVLLWILFTMPFITPSSARNISKTHPRPQADNDAHPAKQT